MSSISVNTITDASGGATTSINGFTPSVSNMAGRNRIINGNFDIWQRGTSFTGNFTNSYGADRWAQGQFQTGPQSRQTITQGQGPTSQYCIRISDTNATGSRSALSQMIESVNSIDLAGQQVTLSFWIRFSAASRPDNSVFDYQLSEYDSVDPVHLSTGATRTNGTNISSGSLPTVWTKYTKTITAGASMKNLGVRFLFNDLRTASSEGDFWYEVAEVQVEAGSVATPFEHRQYGQELALCQRYYYVLSAASNQNTFFSSTSGYTSTQALCVIPFSNTMRTNPSLVTSGTASDYRLIMGGSFLTCSSVPTMDQPNPNSANLIFTVSSGIVVGYGGQALANNTTSAFLGFSAEL